MTDESSLDRRLEQLLFPRLGYLPSRWPETLYMHLRERAGAAGQTEAQYVDATARDADPARLAMIVDAATIGHTAVYRHPEQFEHLRSVLAGMTKRPSGPIRIWCAGCSTGEEAYCAADAAQAAGVNATILATDVNPVAIAVARSGLLPKRGALGGPLPDDWVPRVPETLRRLVRFEVASIVDARPALDAGPFHLILCRNVLIYFERHQIPRLIDRLAGELIPGGHLVLSPAEGVLPLPRGLKRGAVPGWLQLSLGDDPPASARPPSRIPGAAMPDGAIRNGGSKPPPAIPPLEEAARLLSAGRPADAERVLSDLLNADPEHLAGWFLLGEALLSRGERAQARAAFLRATRSGGAPPDIDAEAIRRAANRRADALADAPSEPSTDP